MKCLFSLFLALRIHCSQSFKLLLDNLGGYEIEDRGLVNIKVSQWSIKINYAYIIKNKFKVILILLLNNNP